MREIKFRAWDKKNKKWVCHNKHLNEMQVSASVNPPSILSIKHDDWILMQYTGLKDKNGKKIYEGDIVKTSYKKISIGYIKFYNAEYVIKKGSFVSSINTLIRYKWDLEVKGNIYKNKDLLTIYAK